MRMVPESALIELRNTLIAVVAAATGAGSGNRRVLYVPKGVTESLPDLFLHTEVDFESDSIKYWVRDKPKTVDAEAAVYAEPGTDLVVVNGC